MNNRPYGGVINLKFFCNVGIGNIDKRKPVLYPSAVDMSECAVFFGLWIFFFCGIIKPSFTCFYRLVVLRKAKAVYFFSLFPFRVNYGALERLETIITIVYLKNKKKNLTIHDTEPKLYNSPVLKDDIYYALYFADKFGHIIRVKKGRSYQLYLPGTIELANTIEARND